MNVEKNNLNQLKEEIEKRNITIPEGFIKRLDIAKKLSEFNSFLNSKNKFFLFNKIPNALKNNTGFYVFAFNIGCFSLDERLSQKANVWLTNKLPELTTSFTKGKFNNWMPKDENKEFSEFLFSRNSQTNIEVFSEIIKEKNWEKFLYKIYKEFLNPNSLTSDNKKRIRDNETKKLKLIDNGKNYSPTVKGFKNYFSQKKYDNISSTEDMSLANELYSWGLKKEYYDESKSIMDKFNENKIPKNIVGQHIIEIKKKKDDYNIQTNKLANDAINESKEVIKKLSKKIEKEFTYEWLEKNDPKNFVLGYYCDCCAKLDHVGEGICKSNFEHPDVQNLVIKDENNIIVAKSTLYVNKTQGYGVLNNVEVSNNVPESEKQKIYKSFKKGVKVFAQKYNKKNSQNPLSVITVGMGNNDLEKQIINGKNNSDFLLGLDFSEYNKTKNRVGSGDWYTEQYTIWESNKIR